MRSDSLINNLLLEIDSLSCRLNNINQAYLLTNHDGLRERLIYENNSLSERVKEIFSIAKLLEERKNEKITFSKLLLEKCRRTINQIKIKRDLFFL